MAKILKIKSDDSYLLKITLKYCKPAIWRKVVVHSNIKLNDLHKVIQTAMGWTNSHLHQFTKDDEIYSLPDDEYGAESVDSRKVRLNQLLTLEKQFIEYEYDFGDGWEHKIVLEKILYNEPCAFPYCTAGKRNCPPEDCGGIGGYKDLLEVISDPRNKEYRDMIVWLGGLFDPEYFDKDEINELLKTRDFGCVTFD